MVHRAGVSTSSRQLQSPQWASVCGVVARAPQRHPRPHDHPWSVASDSAGGASGAAAAAQGTAEDEGELDDAELARRLQAEEDMATYEHYNGRGYGGERKAAAQAGGVSGFGCGRPATLYHQALSAQYESVSTLHALWFSIAGMQDDDYGVGEGAEGEDGLEPEAERALSYEELTALGDLAGRVSKGLGAQVIAGLPEVAVSSLGSMLAEDK